jgi:hypothetical protein
LRVAKSALSVRESADMCTLKEGGTLRVRSESISDESVAPRYTSCAVRHDGTFSHGIALGCVSPSHMK